jgi:hypothetical protein
LAVSTRDKVIIPGTSCCQVCGLDSEATFDFAKVSVYDTWANRRMQRVEHANASGQKPTQATFQPAQQVVKPAATQAQTIVTQFAAQGGTDRSSYRKRGGKKCVIFAISARPAVGTALLLGQVCGIWLEPEMCGVRDSACSRFGQVSACRLTI